MSAGVVGETDEKLAPFLGGESGLDFPDKVCCALYEATSSSPSSDTNASAFDDSVGDELSARKV